MTFYDEAISFMSKYNPFSSIEPPPEPSFQEQASNFISKLKDDAFSFLNKTAVEFQTSAQPNYDFMMENYVTPFYTEIKPHLPVIGGVSAGIAGVTLLSSGTSQLFKGESKKSAVSKILFGLMGIGYATYSLTPIIKPVFDAYIEASKPKEIDIHFLAKYKLCANENPDNCIKFVPTIPKE